MATTKRRSAAATSSSKRKVSSRKQDEGIAARTGRTIKQQPYVSAAIATGAVTAVAAAVAGAFFFRRSEKTVGELAEGWSDKIKDGVEDVRGMAAEGIKAAKEKAAMLWNEEPTQSEIAEEALTLKETGRQSNRPIDDTAAAEIKAGAIAY